MSDKEISGEDLMRGPGELPDHKQDLIIKVKDYDLKGEVYITGGWFCGDTNHWHPYGFEEHYFEVIGWWYLEELGLEI